MFITKNFSCNSLHKTNVFPCIHSVCNKYDLRRLLHDRLGHVFVSKIKHLNISYSLQLQDFACDIFHESKFYRLSCPRRESQSLLNFSHLLHMDLWGLYHVASITIMNYFLTIVDNYSRCTWTYMLKYKLQELLLSFYLMLIIISNVFPRTFVQIMDLNLYPIVCACLIHLEVYTNLPWYIHLRKWSC